MPFWYFSTEFEASHLGQALVEVECEKCGCEYYFELARQGVGHVSSPYGIGTSKAEAVAEEKAESNLNDRISSEAELVPCPSCHWINEDLVRGYRLTKLRGWSTAAFSIAIIGIAGSLVATWCIMNGPPPDRSAAPMVAICGPVISIAVAVGIFLLRNGIRSAIRPNKNFPAPPKVPAGTPPALKFDDDTESFVPIAADDIRDSETGGWQTIQIGRVEWPQKCCCCLKSEEDDNTELELANPTTPELGILACKECRRRQARQSNIIGLAMTAFGSIVVYSIFSLLLPREIAFWVLFVTGVWIVALICFYVSNRLTALAPTRCVDASRGVHQVKIKNPDLILTVASGAVAS
ncbi:hypothetical protein [Stratiformator vulcanicus]|uniref:Uncharacterized protein n=1 Tax=Stratiformator vulcanicus TaxID=2527980 RepID=A0A517R5G4_9PLAN|nr:hypothetical protein [Stratiformator vulcanicus]QDT39089.1 hypothetical protein Pan189_34910 [Stratiformator vulcanicus]